MGSLVDASMPDPRPPVDASDDDMRPQKSPECMKKECGARCFVCDRDSDPDCRRTREGRCDNRERCVARAVVCIP